MRYKKESNKKFFSFLFCIFLFFSLPFSSANAMSNSLADNSGISGNQSNPSFNYFFERIKCFFDNSCGNGERRIDSAGSGITGFAVHGFDCPSPEDSDFRAPKRYIREFLEENKGFEDGLAFILNDEVSLGSDWVRGNRLNPFGDSSELEAFYASNEYTDFGAPVNFLSCALKDIKMVEREWQSTGTPSNWGPGGTMARKERSLTTDEKAFAIGHYYQMMNRLRLGQKAALESIAVIDYMVHGPLFILYDDYEMYSLDLLSGDSGFFLDSVQEYSRDLKIWEDQFSGNSIEMKNLDEMLQDSREILDTINNLTDTMFIIQNELDTFFENVSEIAYSSPFSKEGNFQRNLTSLYGLFVFKPGTNIVDFSKLRNAERRFFGEREYYEISEEEMTMSLNVQSYLFENNITQSIENYFELSEVIVALKSMYPWLDGKDSIDSSILRDYVLESREKLKEYVIKAEELITMLNGPGTSYSDVQEAYETVVQSAPVIFENVYHETEPEYWYTVYANRYLIDTEDVITEEMFSDDSIYWHLTVAGALMVAGFYSGGFATFSALTRIKYIFRMGQPVRAGVGIVTMGGHLGYSTYIAADAVRTCNDAFEGVLDGQIGAVSREVEIPGGRVISEPLYGSGLSNNYKDCTIPVMLSTLDVGLVVYTPPRIRQWLDDISLSDLSRSARQIHVANQIADSTTILSGARSISNTGVHPTSAKVISKLVGGNLPQPRHDPDLVRRIEQKVIRDTFGDPDVGIPPIEQFRKSHLDDDLFWNNYDFIPFRGIKRDESIIIQEIFNPLHDFKHWTRLPVSFVQGEPMPTATRRVISELIDDMDNAARRELSEFFDSLAVRQLSSTELAVLKTLDSGDISNSLSIEFGFFFPGEQFFPSVQGTFQDKVVMRFSPFISPGQGSGRYFTPGPPIDNFFFHEGSHVIMRHQRHLGNEFAEVSSASVVGRDNAKRFDEFFAESFANRADINSAYILLTDSRYSRYSIYFDDLFNDFPQARHLSPDELFVFQYRYNENLVQGFRPDYSDVLDEVLTEMRGLSVSGSGSSRVVDLREPSILLERFGGQTQR